jgi:membrane-associated phospholipid phosphatase
MFGQDPPAAAPVVPTAPLAIPNVDRPVSLKRLTPNLLNDQKRMWLSPLKLNHPANLLAASSVIGATAALVALDPRDASYFRGTTHFAGFNNVFTDRTTALGTIAVPASLYLIGLAHKDSKMQHTALLAGEAVADAEIVTTILKSADRRLRPSSVPVGGNFSDSWFENSGGGAGGSFPSGHTIAAFSVATVVARRYGNHRWVPFVAYGLAAAVGFSRVTRSAHYVSDVFVGSALGYSIGRFTVLQQ